MFLVGLGTAVPARRYTQRECWAALQGTSLFASLAPRSRRLLEKVLCGDNGIVSRHLALDSLEEAFDLRPDTLHARFARHAPQLAAQAASRALADAGCFAEEMDAVLACTCTGYLCPGLTSYLTEMLGLRRDVFALDLVGQGCGAALPGLRAAEALVRSGRATRVLVVCVEVCSAALCVDDDPGVLISACLFGDGAAAAVLASAPLRGRRRIEWKFSASRLLPSEREALRFEQQEGRLRNRLSRRVPALAGREATQLLAGSLRAAGLGREAIRGWILHAGGRDVLTALRAELNLTEADVRHSAAVLREFGNLSSPTVLFVLERALQDTADDGWWWMSSFGAGFSCHGALWEVRSA
jgi:alkylresorcinol/alkylpyrone synthase